MKNTENVSRVVERQSLISSLFRWRMAAFILLGLLVFLGRYLDTSSLDAVGSSGSKSIARIFISGIITEDQERDEILKKIADDRNIVALVVHIDSHGGTIVGSEVLYNRLVEISSKKHVVSIMGSTAASGGYMAALATDHIIAHRGTITGSIGVLFNTFDVTELMDKLGVKSVSVRSGELKNGFSPFEKASDKSRENIQSLVCDSYEYFISLVQKHRHLSREEVKLRSDGRLFTGGQALDSSLVDQIGGEDEALGWLESQKIKNLPIKTIELKTAGSWKRALAGNVLSGAFTYLNSLLLGIF